MGDVEEGIVVVLANTSHVEKSKFRGSIVIKWHFILPLLHYLGHMSLFGADLQGKHLLVPVIFMTLICPGAYKEVFHRKPLLILL